MEIELSASVYWGVKMMLDLIKKYYEGYDEDGRLLRDKAHLTEYLTTIRYFDRLFAPNSRILDACAGFAEIVQKAEP